jgi:lipopolysaccharide transport system permease protein
MSVNSQIEHRLLYLRDLLSELVLRDIKLRYKRSLLGIAWSLLNPLAQLLVFSFIFRLVLPLNIDHYASFLFTGLLAWNWFQTSLYAAAGAIIDNRDLIRRPGFPPIVLPVVTVTANFIHFVLALPILLLFLFFSNVQITAAILALPAIFVVQFLFTLSLSYFIAALHVTFRDTQYLMGIVLLLGFYLSPVFYDTSSIPERYQGLYGLNPMAILIGAYRDLLINGRLPDVITLLILSLTSAGLLWLGYRVFTQASYKFAEEL